MQYILDRYKKDKNGVLDVMLNEHINSVYENILRTTTERVLEISTSEANRVSISEYDKKHFNYFNITYKNKNGEVFCNADASKEEVIARDNYFKHKAECKDEILSKTVKKLFETVGEKNVLKFMNSVFVNKDLFDKYENNDVFELPLHDYVRDYLKKNIPEKENTYLMNVFLAQERLDKKREHLTNTRRLLVAFEGEPDAFNFFVNQIKLSDRMKSDKVKFEFYQFVSQDGYSYTVSPNITSAFSEYSGVMEKKGFSFELKETNTFVFTRDSLMSLNAGRTSFNYDSLVEDFTKEFSSKYPNVHINSAKNPAKGSTEQFLSVEKDFASSEAFIYAFCEAVKRTNYTDDEMMGVFSQFLEMKKFDMQLTDTISKTLTKDSDLPNHSTGFKL